MNTLPARFLVTEDPLDGGTLFTLRAIEADECGRYGAPFASHLEKDPTRMEQSRLCFAVLAVGPALLTLSHHSLAYLEPRMAADGAVKEHCGRLRELVGAIKCD